MKNYDFMTFEENLELSLNSYLINFIVDRLCIIAWSTSNLSVLAAAFKNISNEFKVHLNLKFMFMENKMYNSCDDAPNSFKFQ